MDSGRWQQLTTGFHDMWVAWSDHGERLVFSRNGDARDIFVYDMQTGREQFVTDGALAVFEPGGSRLAVVTVARDGIDLVDVDAGRKTSLVRGIGCGRLAWSADGKYLLTDEPRGGQQVLWLIDVRNGRTIPIGNSPTLLHGYSWIDKR